MEILATINKDDEVGGPLIFFGYEVEEEKGRLPEQMFLGIKTEDGDDSIFAYEPSLDRVLGLIETKYSHYNTFRYAKFE